MKAVLSSFLSMLDSCFRTRAEMQIEILALRHQLVVLQRRTNKRARLSTADRLFWVMLSLYVPKIQSDMTALLDQRYSPCPKLLASRSRFVTDCQSMLLLLESRYSEVRRQPSSSTLLQPLLSCAQIAMMQSANLRQRNDLALCWRLDFSSHRRVPF